METNNIIAGAGAGFITKTINAPLDRLKVLYQIQAIRNPNKYTSIISSLRTILQEEGLLGLYKGNLVNCTRIMPAYACKFTFNEFYKSKFNTTNYVNKVAINILTGASQISIVYPLDVLHTRYTMTETKQSIPKYISTFIQKEGLQSFYKGYPVSLLTGSLHIGLQLSFFDIYKTEVLNKLKTDTIGTKLICGSLAGVSAQFLTFPGDVLKKRMHANGILGEEKLYKNTFDCVNKIIKNEGYKGFYNGFRVSAIKTFPSAAIQFTSFDILRNLLTN